MHNKHRLASIIAAVMIAHTPGQAAEGNAAYGPPKPEEIATTIAVPLETPPGLPPALVQATEIATRNYPTIKRSTSERNARKSELRGAKWLSFPSVSVEALALTGGSSNVNGNGAAANLVLEQPLWAGGKIAGTIGRAKASLLASNSAIRETELEIALRTVQTYYELALASKRSVILMASLDDHRELLGTIGRRVDQEVSPRADLELGKSRTAQIEQELAGVEGQRATSYSQLLELIGSESIELGNVPAFDPALTVGESSEIVALTLACSPTLERLGYERLAAEADRKIARGALFPQLVVQASHNEITGSRAGFALRLQTGNGLSQFSAVSTAESKIESASFAISTAQREIREQVRVDVLSYEAARNRIESGGRASTSSTLVTESYKRQFIAGRRTWLDVMNAVREAMSSQLSEAEAEITAMAAATKITLRTCAWQPAGLKQEQVD